MTTPQDFDVDAWLDGAERPARSVTVYQKAGLIADLDRLEQLILNAQDDEADPEYERQLGYSSESQKLEREYRKFAKQFHDSALTIRVQGHDEDEKRELAQAHKGLEAGELGYIILADAITSPKVTAEQLKRLAKKIGEAQFNQIPEAYHRVCSEVPAVSADFLPKPSTPDDGGE